MQVDRFIPQNLEAEMAILGCILLDNSIIRNISGEIESTDFYDNKNKTLFKTMQEINLENKVVDVVSLVTKLEEKNVLNICGGIEYLSVLANINYTTSNYDTYVKIVKEQALKRQTINTLSTVLQDSYDTKISAMDMIENLENKITEISKKKPTKQFLTLNNLLKEVQETIEKNSETNGEITGLNTGFDNLNKVTLGLQKENLIILAARPAMGKSAFAMNLALNVARLNKNGKANVVVFSLEMGANQLVERMLSSESTVSLTNLKKGNLESKDWRVITDTNSKLKQLNIYFDDSSDVTVNQIRAKCSKLAQDKGLDFVIIDYLQLIDGSQSNKSKYEEISKISRSLKMMSRELKIPVLALAQLSREVEKRENKKPIMADLRDSGSIEQDADIVTFLYREDYYKKNSDRPNEADLIIAKNRSGISGVELNYIFQKGFQKFIEKK